MKYFNYFEQIADNVHYNSGVGGGDPLEVSLRQSKLIYDLYPKDKPPPSLAVDYGCGVGRTIPTLSILWPNTKFVGVDISIDFLNFCASHSVLSDVDLFYSKANIEHYRQYNSEAQNQKIKLFDRAACNINADFVYAYSVLTHLNEREALGLFADIASLLKPGGVALVSCFVLDSHSVDAINTNSCSPFKFEVKVGSDSDWFEGNLLSPGAFTAFSLNLLDYLCNSSALSVRQFERGSWRMPFGRSFHDMLLVEKRHPI
jgi:SAM-dependent methyltransferase